MNELSEQTIYCPYCGEPIEVLIEDVGESQEYIEDCQVCCRPIIFTVAVDIDGSSTLSVRAENETF